MPKIFGRTMRKAAAVLGVFAVGVSTLGATVPDATKPGTLHAVSLEQITGTPGFDKQSGPGLDTSGSNDVIRTNDTMVYNVEIQTGRTAPKSARIDIKLPAGEQSKVLPPYCLAGTSSATPAIGDPGPGLTKDSHKQLPQQTISCDLGKLNASQSYVYPIYSTVRPEVPNGTKLGAVSATITTDTESKTTNGVSHTVSAAALFDTQMGFSSRINGASVNGPLSALCSIGDERPCYRSYTDMGISAPVGGKGISPIEGDFQFTVNMDPNVIYGPGTTDTDGWKKAAKLTDAEKEGLSDAEQQKAAFDKAWAKFKPILSIAPGVQYGPNPRIAGTTATAENSARNSGKLNITTDGTDMIVNVSGADTSVWTYPSNTARKGTLPADRAVVANYRMILETPEEAISELSLESRNGMDTSGNLTLVNRLQLSEIRGKSLDGSAVKTYRSEDNSYRQLNVVLKPSGSWETFFAGIPGSEGNTPASDFRPTWQSWEGLPGSSMRNQGDGMLMEEQKTIFTNTGFLTKGNLPAAGRMACNIWDDNLSLTGGDYGPEKSFSFQNASNGDAVWLSRTNFGGEDTTKALIQYGHGTAGNGDRAICGDSDSDVGWHDSPEDVPGNDPAKLKDGIYTGVNKVRVLIKTNYVSREFFEVPVVLSHQGGAKAGDTAQAWYSVSETLDIGSVDAGFNEAFKAKDTFGEDFQWKYKSTYRSGPVSSDTFMGNYGDRVIISDAYTSVKLDVKDGAGVWQPGSAEFEAGSAAEFKITPVISAPIDTGKKFSPTVEVCLPAGTSFVGNSGSLAPSGFSTTELEGAHVSCAEGGTLVKWNLNGYEANSNVPPITFMASSYSSMEDTSVSINAGIGLPSEGARTADRQDSASMNLMSPMTAGFDLAVHGGNSLIDVDPFTASKTPGKAKWKMEYFNRGSAGQIGNIDMSILLPRNGFAGSKFNGTSTLAKVDIVQGSNAEVFLSTSSAPKIDSAGKVAGGTWVKESAYTGKLSDVTAVRIKRAGLLTSGQGVAAVIETEVRNNRTGDTYRAIGSGSAGSFQGIQVNDDEDNTVSVKGGSIGDRVWADLDGDGLQDAGEKGIPNVPVSLTGTTHGGDVLPKKSTTTDANGMFTFDNLPAGTYTVTYDKAWLTERKWNITQTRMGQGVNDSAPGSTGTYTLTLAKHDDVDNADAGLVGDASVAIYRTHGRDTDWIYRGQYPSQHVTIKNTGDFEVTGINVTDAAVGPVSNYGYSFNGTRIGAVARDDAAKSFTWSGTLKPGESVKVKLDQLVASNAEASALIRNTIQGSGSWIGGKAKVTCTQSDFLTPDDCTGTSKVAVPSLSYSASYTDSGSRLANKSGETVLVEAKDGKFGPGEKLSMAQKVTNTGNVPMTLREALLGVTGTEDRKTVLDRDAQSIIIQPGQSHTFTVKDLSTVKQSQVDLNELSTYTKVHVMGPNDYQLHSMDNTVGVAIPVLNRAPDLFMTGTAEDDSGNGILENDENGRWIYTVVNTGNLTLNSVDVKDLIGGKLTAEDGFDGELSPGEKIVLKRIGKVPSGLFSTDGLFRNDATASAKTPLSNDRFTVKDTAATWLSGKSDTGLDLVKTLVDASGDGIVAKNETYRYEFKLVNNSDETFSHVSLEDPTLSALLGTNAWNGPDSWNEVPTEERVLRPGQSAKWVSRNLTGLQADAVAGFVENKAHVTAVDSNNDRQRSNYSVARVSAVSEPVVIAAGSGAGIRPVAEASPGKLLWLGAALLGAVSIAGVFFANYRRKS